MSGDSPVQRMKNRLKRELTPEEEAEATAKGEQNYLSKSGHGRADHSKRASSTPEKTKEKQAAKSKQQAIDEVIQLKSGISSLILQPKLSDVPVNDNHEVEADQAAHELTHVAEQNSEVVKHASLTWKWPQQQGTIQLKLIGQLASINDEYLKKFDGSFPELKKFKNRQNAFEYLKEQSDEIGTDEDMQRALGNYFPKAEIHEGVGVAGEESVKTQSAQESPKPFIKQATSKPAPAPKFSVAISSGKVPVTVPPTPSISPVSPSQSEVEALSPTQISGDGSGRTSKNEPPKPDEPKPSQVPESTSSVRASQSSAEAQGGETGEFVIEGQLGTGGSHHQAYTLEGTKDWILLENISGDIKTTVKNRQKAYSMFPKSIIAKMGPIVKLKNKDGKEIEGVLLQRLSGSMFHSTNPGWSALKKKVETWKKDHNYMEKLQRLKEGMETFINAGNIVDDFQYWVLDDGKFILSDVKSAEKGNVKKVHAELVNSYNEVTKLIDSNTLTR